MKDLKAFKAGGEILAELCHWQTPGGRLIIDVNGVTVKPGDARRLAAWLIEAAGVVVDQPRTRKSCAGERKE